jgi:hypothetical protein
MRGNIMKQNKYFKLVFSTPVLCGLVGGYLTSKITQYGVFKGTLFILIMWFAMISVTMIMNLIFYKSVFYKD